MTPDAVTYLAFRRWLSRLDSDRPKQYELRFARSETPEEKRVHMAKVRRGNRRAKATKRWSKAR